MILDAIKRWNVAHTPREVTHVTVRSPRIRRSLTLAVAADLHDGGYLDALPHLQGCDAILIPGDLVDRHSGGYTNALGFLDAAAQLAPVFYAIGNHEWKHPAFREYWPQVLRRRVTVLDDRFVPFSGIVVGGLTSRKDPRKPVPMVAKMAKRPEFRLLMCHHPEYYAGHVKPHGIDLTLAGHAHGGQVRLGGQGLYAPGQGLLPKLTSGLYEGGRLLVTRGMTNATWAPRVHCPCELIILHLEGEDG